MYVHSLRLHISSLKSCEYTVYEREPCTKSDLAHCVAPGISYLHNSSHRCPIYTMYIRTIYVHMYLGLYISDMASARLQRCINHVDFGVVCDPMCDA